MLDYLQDYRATCLNVKKQNVFYLAHIVTKWASHMTKPSCSTNTGTQLFFGPSCLHDGFQTCWGWPSTDWPVSYLWCCRGLLSQQEMTKCHCGCWIRQQIKWKKKIIIIDMWQTLHFRFEPNPPTYFLLAPVILLTWQQLQEARGRHQPTRLLGSRVHTHPCFSPLPSDDIWTDDWRASHPHCLSSHSSLLFSF